MDASIINDALSCRAFAYHFVWRIFAAEATSEFASLARDAQTYEQFQALFGENNAALNALKTIAALDIDENTLSNEFTRLFVGPEKAPAPAWESVYTSPDELLFQMSTLSVRQAFKNAGYHAAGYPHEPDDALATELHFMFSLSQDSADNYAKGDKKIASMLLRHQRLFLDEHLNVWMGQFSDRLAENLPKEFSTFYTNAAILARELCSADRAIVDELISAI